MAVDNSRGSRSVAPLQHARGITFDVIPGYSQDHLEFREGDQKGSSTVTQGSSNVLLRAPWMREAIVLGIDRQRFINTAYGHLAGNQRPLNNALYYSNQTHYRPDFQKWNYKPAKALAILKKHCAAGTGPTTPSPTNTKIWQCSGLPTTFNWTWKVDNDAWRVTEQIAKAELKSIGVQINETPLSRTSSRRTASVRQLRHRGVHLGDGGDPGDFYDAWRCGGVGNYTGYCSHRVDALLQRANGTLDPIKRASLYQRADAIMATQVPTMPLYQRPIALIHRSNLLGMVPNAGVAGPVWNIEDWHWKR